MKRAPHRSPVMTMLPYRLAIRAAVPLVPILLRDPQARRGHAGRLRAPASLAAWAGAHRDPARPLLWMHAASVGEGLQARAVLEAIRALRPDLQLVATRFSASAERLAATIPADHVDYLPYDRPRDVARCLDALRPDALIFAKLDVWPQLATAAAGRGVAAGLVAGSVDPGSHRLRWGAREIAAPGYRALEAIGAIDQDNAERLVQLGCRPDRIVVTGDPRVDSVLAEVEAARAEPALAVTDAPDRTLVAGSTWPADEQVLLEAFAAVRSRHPDARLVLVPHQPDEASTARLVRAAASHGLMAERWGGTPSSATVVLVDRLGVLPRLYPGGVIAYVGGGFGLRGVHSVLEPAGWQRPVIIGPHDRGVRDARLLADAGGLIRLPEAQPARELARHWSGWLDDPQATRSKGEAACAALAPDRGAARRSAEVVLSLLPAASRTGAAQPPKA